MADQSDSLERTTVAQPSSSLATPVHLSILAPTENESGPFQGHVRACLAAVADLGVELVLIDNLSINGCTHELPCEVLILRMETEQSPAGLWRHGRRLASGTTLLWIPHLAACKPEALRSLVLSTQTQSPRPGTERSDRRRIRGLLGQAFAVDAQSVLRMRFWASLPWVGPTLARLAEFWLTSTNVRPIEIEEQAAGLDAKPDVSAVRMNSRRPLLSVIITAHNEGDEVLRTVESVQTNAGIDHEIIVVDDGSTDGSCDDLERLGVRVIRINDRIGVAYSRDLGTRQAIGDAFAYLDGHQRVDRGCLDRATEIAIEYQAITCPLCRPLRRRYPVAYGASFRLCPKRGVFDAYTRTDRSRKTVTWISALRSPGYVIPRGAYDRVAWIDGVRGWGATDLSLGVKCFFTDVDILHVNVGATEHLFRKDIPYPTTDEAVWRNHALIARVCFDERTWNRYWYPEVFDVLLSDQSKIDLDAPNVLVQHAAFQERKARPDREFWRGLLRVEEPRALR